MKLWKRLNKKDGQTPLRCISGKSHLLISNCVGDLLGKLYLLYFEDFLLFSGFVCVSGFDKKEQALRLLRARLHFPASRLKTSKTSKPKIDEKEKLMQ
ncbi:hypothetical protein L1987_00054 [Smallanthus sonchifolius]|uniref:Uncharacterized protein n=1 Tax=Smallanthus sonchifolius TaxID=185202 RepID=A0ACB9K181_9ASTR|nr:hypothetical protein L1987_00054 [Smallanthus sonchifolius]